MAKCGLKWLPIDGELRYVVCETEATVPVRAPGEKKAQKVCPRHAGQLAGLLVQAGTIAESYLT